MQIAMTQSTAWLASGSRGHLPRSLVFDSSSARDPWSSATSLGKVEAATLAGDLTSSVLASAVLLSVTMAHRQRGRRAARTWIRLNAAPLGSDEASAVGGEKALEDAIAGFAANRDPNLVFAALERMPRASCQAALALTGNWEVKWSSLGTKSPPKDSTPPAKPPAVNLKFMSFGALPGIEVNLTGSFNRVFGEGPKADGIARPGGIYELLQVFSVPGEADGPSAAMVLSGPWSGPEENDPSTDGPARCEVRFQTVRLEPSTKDAASSLEMLRKVGLGEYLMPTELKAKSTYIDLEYMSPSVRVHRGESGAVYVLSRLGGVGFESDAIPFGPASS
mmetsp:Transcript_138090/g.441183  ORF Transcript_138090/g.441183 Transcript_138090/m.441183 type:complete len:335 (-) Transcript_138090:42-1046(-)